MPADLKKDGKIAVITINNPPANLINVATWRDLTKALQEFRDDPEIWVGVITGAGDRNFCGGADARDLLPFMKQTRTTPWERPVAIMTGLEVWKPIVAAINGNAQGGGLEICMSCDIRICSETARLGTPEVNLGVIPGWGGTQRLPRAIPWCKAAEILMMGKGIDAQEAYRIGLVNKLVPQDKVLSTAMEWAEALCQPAPLAVRAVKEAMYRGYDMNLADGLKLEAVLFNNLLVTEDHEEGIKAAFVEKRKPVFKAK